MSKASFLNEMLNNLIKKKTLFKSFKNSVDINDNFSLEVGTFHEKPVGPHPCWSFQVKFDTKMFGIFVPWLMENRNRLTVFIHACTGDNLLDHTENVCWLGQVHELNLEIFN